MLGIKVLPANCGDKIKDNNQKIDLLIVTHTDDDHIKGIIKFIEDDTLNNYIQEVWFNSCHSNTYTNQ